MEGANEGARRAVNVILQRAASRADQVQTWPLSEPDDFAPWKRLDQKLYEDGRPHLFELMGIRRAAQAADTVRRFAALTGISKVDDLLDEVRATSLLRGLLSRLGVP